jgi:hypothetical protein
MRDGWTTGQTLAAGGAESAARASATTVTVGPAALLPASLQAASSASGGCRSAPRCRSSSPSSRFTASTSCERCRWVRGAGGKCALGAMVRRFGAFRRLHLACCIPGSWDGMDVVGTACRVSSSSILSVLTLSPLRSLPAQARRQLRHRALRRDDARHSARHDRHGRGADAASSSVEPKPVGGDVGAGAPLVGGGGGGGRSAAVPAGINPYTGAPFEDPSDTMLSAAYGALRALLGPKLDDVVEGRRIVGYSGLQVRRRSPSLSRGGGSRWALRGSSPNVPAEDGC